MLTNVNTTDIKMGSYCVYGERTNYITLIVATKLCNSSILYDYDYDYKIIVFRHKQNK